MKTRRTLWLLPMLAAVAVACGGGGAEGDEYAEAIPTVEMLELSFEEEGAVSSALSEGETTGQALVGDPSHFQAHARKVADGLNALFEKTFAGLRLLMDATVPQEKTWKGRTCKVWEGDGPKVHWELSSCRSGGQGKAGAFDFLLRGRPLGSTSEDDYLPVLAGYGVKLPEHKGHRRGVGKVGFNFDNLAALTGEEIGGRLGVAYRAAGRARHLVIGLDAVTGPNLAEPLRGTYRYFHVLGQGGRFSFVGFGDYVGTDVDGKLVPGRDGVDEFGRAVMGWRTDGSARTVLMACGGTVDQVRGHAACVRVAQCWDANAHITFQDVFGQNGDPITWEPVQCPSIPLPIDDQVPGEGEAEPPRGTQVDTGAPIDDEPMPMPEFE